MSLHQPHLAELSRRIATIFLARGIVKQLAGKFDAWLAHAGASPAPAKK